MRCRAFARRGGPSLAGRGPVFTETCRPLVERGPRAVCEGPPTTRSRPLREDQGRPSNGEGRFSVSGGRLLESKGPRRTRNGRLRRRRGPFPAMGGRLHTRRGAPAREKGPLQVHFGPLQMHFGPLQVHFGPLRKETAKVPASVLSSLITMSPWHTFPRRVEPRPAFGLSSVSADIAPFEGSRHVRC